MDKIAKEFLVESYASLECLEHDLVILEKNPQVKLTLRSIFRTIRTAEETSGLLGYGRLEAAAHAGEVLLGKLRDGVITFSPEFASTLMATVDAIHCMLGQVETVGYLGERENRDLIDRPARSGSGGDTPTDKFLAPTTAWATAVAVPAMRRHAAVDPQPVAVVAPTPFV